MSDDLVKQLRDHVRQIHEWGRKFHSDADLVDEAADRIEQLEGLLELYRDAVLIDVTMQGPIFRGANSSALKRAWYHDMGKKNER